MMRVGVSVLGLLAAGAAIAGIWWYFGSGDEPEARPSTGAAETKFEDFVGAEACGACHKEQYDLWKKSTHGRAGGTPTSVDLIARFDGKPLKFKDAVVTPLVNAKGEHVFKVEPHGQPPQEVRADYVVGGGHMYGGGTQSFFGRFPDGTVRFLPFDYIRDEKVWFVQLKAGGVWVPVSEKVSLQRDLANWPPHRALGSHAELSNCQNCHGSQISVVKSETKGGWHTRFTTLQINCESCHGAGRRHVEIVSKPGWEKLEDIGMEPLQTLSKDESLNVCFKCHAGKSVLTDAAFLPRPKEPFDEFVSLKLPMFDGSRFMVDGRIRLFGYQGNHLYSDCYLNGSMTCVDCHDPHSNDYRDVFSKKLEGKFDDGQCTGCHAAKAIEPAKHSHHAPGTPGGRCTDCHMPFLQHQGLGSHLKFARSDHTIPIPRPAFDAKIGIENACAKCHADKSIDSLQKTVDEWYGETKPHHPVVADLAKAMDVTDAAVAKKLLLHPESNHAMAQMDGLFTYLRKFFRPNRPDRDVVAKLRAFAANDDLDLKAVAMMALEAGYGRDPEIRKFLAAEIAKLGAKEAAVKSRWAITADQLGGIYVEKKDPRSGVRFMESAVVANPDDVTIRSHLALTYTMIGDGDNAIAQIEAAIRIEPENANLRVQLGQCCWRFNRVPQAIEAFKEALRIDPNDAEARQILQQLERAGK